jgi:hypothetical protein
MKDATRSALIWSPRILGFLVAAFLGMFGLDALGESQGIGRSTGALFIHLLPTFLTLGVVYVSWKRPWFGAIAFLLFATAYAATSLAHPSWIATIAGPLAVAGVSYLLSWRVATAAREK